MEREPYYPAVGVLIATQISHTVLFFIENFNRFWSQLTVAESLMAC